MCSCAQQKANCVLCSNDLRFELKFFALDILECLWSKNCCLFERFFKVKKSGVFFFRISFFVIEIFTFLHYANKESDDVIDGSTKPVQHSINNISRNIGAVFFKLGTRNVHNKKKRMTPSELLPWQHSWPQSLSVENQTSPFPTL